MRVTLVFDEKQVLREVHHDCETRLDYWDLKQVLREYFCFLHWEELGVAREHIKTAEAPRGNEEPPQKNENNSKNKLAPFTLKFKRGLSELSRIMQERWEQFIEKAANLTSKTKMLVKSTIKRTTCWLYQRELVSLAFADRVHRILDLADA